MTAAPTLLGRYILRRSLAGIGLCLAALTALTSLIEAIEIFRRASGRDFDIALAALALGLPAATGRMLPFAVLLGLVWSFANLARENALVAWRAAGRPLTRAALPAALLSFGLGAIDLLLLDPLAARIEPRREALYRAATGAPATPDRIWLTARDDAGATWFVKLSGPPTESGAYRQGLAFAIDGAGGIGARIDGGPVRLEGGRPVFASHVRADDGRSVEIPLAGPPLGLGAGDAALTGQPAAAFAWAALPAAIRRLERLGLDSTTHRFAWHRRLADNLLLVAFSPLALAIAAFGHPRGSVAPSFGFGISLGFLLFFAAELIGAFGLAGRLPVPLAAWAPAFLAAVLAALLHLTVEDG